MMRQRVHTSTTSSRVASRAPWFVLVLGLLAALSFAIPGIVQAQGPSMPAPIGPQGGDEGTDEGSQFDPTADDGTRVEPERPDEDPTFSRTDDDLVGMDTMIKLLSYPNKFPLTDAIEEFADFFALNVVFGPNVGGSVTMTVANVTAREALEAMLDVNGYKIEDRENLFVVVKKTKQVINRRTKVFEFDAVYDVMKISTQLRLLASSTVRMLVSPEVNVIFVNDEDDDGERFSLMEQYVEIIRSTPPVGDGRDSDGADNGDSGDKVITNVIPLPQEIDRIKPAIMKIINPLGNEPQSRADLQIIDRRDRMVLVVALESRMTPLKAYLEYLRKTRPDSYEPPSERIETIVFTLQQPASIIKAALTEFLSDSEFAQIIENPTSNSLIVTDVATQFPRIERFVQELDTEPMQVFIDAAFLEYSITEVTDFSLTNAINVAGGNLTWRYLTPGSSVKPTTIVTGAGITGPLVAGVPTNGAISNYQLGFARNGDMDVALGLLAQETNTNILSKPKLVIANNKTGLFKVGQEVPYISGISSAGGSASVDFKDITLTLEVTPHIETNNRIRLEVHFQIIDQIGTVTAGDLAGSPILSRREVQTEVYIQDGDTLILGGFYKDAETIGAARIPILGDLPILGALFSQTNTRHEKNDLLFIITPTVIRTSIDLPGGYDKDGRRLTFTWRPRLHIPSWATDPSITRIASLRD